MNLQEEFPSKWLKGDDLDEPRVVTIETVGIEEFDSRNSPGKKEKKLSLMFKGEDKGIICNVGMRNIVTGFYGPETDEWEGKKIRIMQAPFTNDKGETSMVVRIHPKKPETAAAKAVVKTPAADENADTSGIPF